MFEDRELVVEFVNESREHLADIEGQLLGIEEGGANADPALVNDVFRSVHSIKGAAGFMGFSVLGKLAHELENVLNLIRNGRLVPTSPIVDVMLKAADKLRALINDIDHSNEADIDDHICTLERIIAGLLAEESPATAAVTKEEAPHREETHVKEAKKRKKAAVRRDIATEQPDAAAAEAKLPTAPAAKEPHAPPVADTMPQTVAAPRTAASESSHSPAADATIRVNVGILDRLMTLAGELVLSRNQLLQTLGSKDVAKLDSVSSRVDQVTTDLHETVMQARMQVVGTVFNRFPRVVRDLSAKLGKQCELKIEGAEVELDKSIIEAIGDPLTHLVRNAVDHGVESAQQRQAAGKPAKATVVLRAYHESGKVNISISDDGGGIDVAKVKQKAVDRGLLSPDQARAKSEREALGLIFRPGFSLAEKVTDVSGRGVGMDVVKTNIERVGGNVSVETEIGKGTTVQVRLPLTLAIIPCLIVHSSGNRYAIPQSSICELVRVKRSETEVRIQQMKNAEVLRLRGTLLPLVRLPTVLGFTPADGANPPAAQNIVVAEAGHMRFGLVVQRFARFRRDRGQASGSPHAKMPLPGRSDDPWRRPGGLDPRSGWHRRLQQVARRRNRPTARQTTALRPLRATSRSCSCSAMIRPISLRFPCTSWRDWSGFAACVSIASAAAKFFSTAAVPCRCCRWKTSSRLGPCRRPTGSMSSFSRWGAAKSAC